MPSINFYTFNTQRTTIVVYRGTAKVLALYGQKKKLFTNKFMKRLKNFYRLVPDKHTIFGKKYSLLELKEYAHDVNPRQFA